MVSKNQQAERLPAGWKVEIRVKRNGKYKCYTNKKITKKFYSKLSILRYIKDISIGNNSSSKMKGHTKKKSAKKQLDAVDVNDLHEWLPSDWIMELRTRKTGIKKGTKYKCFIDPATGSKFFSKPEVQRYLESLQSNPGSSQGREKGSSTHSSNKKSPDPPIQLDSCMESNVSQLSRTRVQKSQSLGKRKVVVETTADNELPSGWIKELRNKMDGKQVVRSDYLYIDPTGLVFRSKSDALRYIMTGEVSKHAYQRKNISSNGEEYAVVKTSPPRSVERKKAKKTITGKQLFADELSPKECISSLPEASCIKETGYERKLRSSSRIGNHDHSILLLQAVNSTQKTSPRKSLIDNGKKDDATPTEIKRMTRSSSKVVNLESANSAQEKKIDATGNMTKKPLPKVQVDDGMKVDETPRESKRITRSSSKVKPANSAQVTSPRKSLTEKINATELTGSMTKRPLPEIQVDRGMRVDETPRESKRITRSSSKVKPVNSTQETKKIDAAEVAGGMTKMPLPNFKYEDATPTECKRMARSSLGVVNLDQETSPGKSLAENIYATEVIESMNKVPPPKIQDDRGKKDDATRRKNIFSVPSKDMLLEEKTETVAMKSCSNERVLQTSKKKIRERKQTPFRSTNQELRKVQDDTSLRSQEKPQSIDFVARDVRVENPEKIKPLNTMIAIQEGPFRLCFQPEIDLLERYPPGFSQNPRIESSPIRADQSVYPKNVFTDVSLGNIQLAKDPIQVEQPAIARELENPGSQFCFTSPMWSDPCLEFAFKTLTGAIPLDDSLAIQDYIQHQIRTTSEQSNNNRSLPIIGNVQENPKSNGVSLSLPENK